MKPDEFVAFLLGFLAGLIGGCLAISCIAESAWRREAIQHKAAHYDEATGKFEWNVEVTK